MNTRTIVGRPVTIGELCELMGFPQPVIEGFLSLHGICPAFRVGRSRIRCYSPEQVERLIDVAERSREQQKAATA